MDIAALIATGITTGIVSIPLAAFLGRSLVEHQFAKSQSFLNAKIRQDVDTYLAERAAQRSYEWDARKRLYEAVGPLRFQLLIACRDLCGRVESFGTKEHYDTNVTSYYGASFLYRILRPLSICSLIERQMAYADFSVDPDILFFLRLQFAARTCFSGELLVKGHSNVNWAEQEQHVFAERLSAVAESIIISEPNGLSRVMRFEELYSQLRDSKLQTLLDPFPSLLDDFSPRSKPLLWLRLVGFAIVCRQYVETNGAAICLTPPTLSVEALIQATDNQEILSEANSYGRRFNQLKESPF